jgi:hypothetical protein
MIDAKTTANRRLTGRRPHRIFDEERHMNIEEAVAAATDEATTLLSCLGQPVVAYHVTAIMREADVEHARQMQQEFLQRSVEALVADGLEDAAAERFACVLDSRVGSAWRLLHASDDGTLH